ncbi:hypothetical protein R6Q59_016479 [Mikania micrantha]
MATKRSRISWKQEGVEKTFLQSCFNELTLHGREEVSFKALSWKKVAEKLQSDYGFVADQKQMKNRYDYLKAKFSVWTKLKNKNAKMMIENHKASNDMEACMKKLGTMGWDEFDAKYQTTLLLFSESADIRKVWLQLQPQTYELQAKNAEAKYNLF